MMHTPECGQAYIVASAPLEPGALAPTAEEQVRALRERLAHAEALLERWAAAARTARPPARPFDPAEPELMIAGLVSDAGDAMAVRRASTQTVGR